MKLQCAIVFALLAISYPVHAQNGPDDAGAPLVSGEYFRKLDSLTAPLVDSARRTWPVVRKRFLKGLPVDQTLFVMTRLSGNEGEFEQIFLQVDRIAADTIHGTIASDVVTVRGFKHGASHSIREADLLDWSITHPDGSEEGNVVGKFMDWMQNPGTKD